VRILAGDIGGTYARFALFEHGEEGLRILRRARYRSGDHPGLAPAARRFLGELDEAPDGAAFGVACPVVEGRCRFPNLEWDVDVASLRRELGIERTRLVNDFDAVAHALPHLGARDVAVLHEGVERPGEVVAVVGPGTGLGHAFLSRRGDGVRVHSSEGGHAALAPRNALEAGLVAFLRRRYGRASWERAVSGPGLVNLYRYLAASGWAPQRPDTRRALEEEGDDAPAEISRRALEGTDELCSGALDLFVALLGARAGDFVLEVQGWGGLVLAGGIAPRILGKLRAGEFLGAFRAKGRFSAFLQDLPVRVITNGDVGLIGAAAALVEAG